MLCLHFSRPGLYKKGQFPCLYPGICNGKVAAFGRPADLERHYKNVHADEKDSFRCDYRKCSRSKVENAFTRKDHYRDHLRDYHKEDIGCAKGEKSSREKDKIKWQKAQRVWLDERNISYTNWRCVRCLTKNYVEQQGWECSTCKSPCEEDRVRARQNLGPGMQTPDDRSEVTMVDDAQYAAPYCAPCHGTSYVDYGYGLSPCSDCHPSAGYSYQPIVYQQ
jgi:ribosomal protein L37AE/L43A